MTTTTTSDKQEIRKRDYKYLLQKYKNVEEANDFFKLQLQDLNSRLKIEHKEKERLHQELQRARSDIVGKKPHGHGTQVAEADLEELNNRLREAYDKLEEEFEQREQLNKDLEYTKAMLLAEGKTRMLLETRNTVLEQELRARGSAKSGSAELQAQLEETKRRMEEEMKGRLVLQEAKERLEAELEDLTKSLFEEANSMVSKEAREKYELQQAKKRLEEELELAKSKIILDEKLLCTMKNKFTVLEMKAKKLHRRAGSATSAMTAVAAGALLQSQSQTQLRPTSSHPNLLTLRDDVELLQRAKSFVHLSQASSLPSSPVSHGHHGNASHHAGSSAPNNIHAPLSPEPHHHPSTTPRTGSSHSLTSTPAASPSTSPTKPIPINLPTNPISTSPISTSPLAQDFTMTTGTTISSDETYSEGLSQHDTASLAEEYNDEWDVDWLLEEGGEEKQDDNVLFAEVEGRIDLQGGLSHFVQFLSAAKQDWAGRFMDRVLREDVGPCLRLRSSEDRAYRKLLEAVWNNKIFVEPLGHVVQEVCAGCGAESTCKWRVKMGSSQECKNMGDLCRERIIRTCDFYCYLRNLKQGLVKKTLPNIFKEYLRLRLMMNFARICAG